MSYFWFPKKVIKTDVLIENECWPDMPVIHITHNACHYSRFRGKFLRSDTYITLGNNYTLSMMTSSNGTFFPRYWPLCRGFTSHRWISHKGQWRGALMFSLICAPIQQLGKQWRRRRFETPSRSLWRHCNAMCISLLQIGCLGIKNHPLNLI